jgi:hypothetical protein
MKAFRLLCLAGALLPLLCACNLEPEDSQKRYDEAPPLTLTINALPADSFSPGRIVYVSLEGDDWVAPGKVQGNVPVGEDGTAIISLHYPTGIPFKAAWDFVENAFIYILENNKTDKQLYKTKETVPFEPYAANVSISFSDFTAINP